MLPYSVTPTDQDALMLFSRMFVFSALLVAGYVAVATRQKGARRALASFLAFLVSYAVLRGVLYYVIVSH